MNNNAIQSKGLSIALVGNPNAGKTSIFNALTGSNQKVGNWPGVTVAKKTGLITCENLIEHQSVPHEHSTHTLTDLPGIYSLTQLDAQTSLDERIAFDYILSGQADVLINVIDSANLQRGLYLTTQLRELGLPMIVVLNMQDLAEKRNIQINTDTLSEKLQCPVLTTVANNSYNTQNGIETLKKCLFQLSTQAFQPYDFMQAFSPELKNAVIALSKQISIHYPQFSIFDGHLALRLLEGCEFAQQILPLCIQSADRFSSAIEAQFNEPMDLLIADQRYGFSHEVVQAVMRRSQVKLDTFSARIDNIVLNRFLGVPVFLIIMYCMFLFAINIGGVFQDFFDITSEAIFINAPARWFHQWGMPDVLNAILTSGIGRGINTTVTFIPVIGAMFLFLSTLEASGYMARAAFVMDRIMRALGLPGKAFVPLIVGFGCNVPAVMATRTLNSERDRILTTMMTPFMSCGARLAIFAVFASAFFPNGGQNLVFALYVIGVVVAILTGLLLRKTLLTGQQAPFIMELPTYQIPSWRAVIRQSRERLSRFLFKAGKVIIPLCMLLGVLNSLSVTGNLVEGGEDSLLACIGKTLTPLFGPMGISQENWPATVGLLTGTLAKEVVVATLNTLYSQVAHLHLAQVNTVDFSIFTSFREALSSIVINLRELPQVFLHPMIDNTSTNILSHSTYGVMVAHFGSQASAFAYLLFVLLYVPCVSTVAVIARELNRTWAAISVIWSTAVAYSLAVGFYQLSQIQLHPLVTVVWLGTLLLGLGVSMLLMRWMHGAQSQDVIQSL